MFSRLQSDGFAYGPKMRRKMLALQKLAQREVEQTFDALSVQHARDRETAGISGLERKYFEAARAWGMARRRMVKVAPRTPEGADALAGVIEDFEYDLDVKIGTRTLARAVGMAARAR